jgi:outer membrane receptor protein involved in Fe transport
MDGHYLSFGGNTRYTHIEEPGQAGGSEDLTYERFDEGWAGLFLSDHYDTDERVFTESQARVDWFSGTQIDWSARLSAMRRMDEDGMHVARISAAKSYRAPGVQWRERRFIVPGVLYLLPEPGGLKNEETWSIEAGYAGRLGNGVSLNVDTYYQRIERLIRYNLMREPNPQTGRTFGSFDNGPGADTYGAEVELAIEKKKRRLAVWYGYNGFDFDETGQAMRCHPPAPHKAGVRSRFFLDNDWTINVNYRYNDRTPQDAGIFTTTIPVYHHFDVAVTKEFAAGRGRLTIGVDDALNKWHKAVDGGNRMPGRTFFARVGMSF